VRQQLLNCLGISSIAVTIAQPIWVQVAPINDIQLKPTGKGLEVVLETAGTFTEVLTSSTGNSLITDIPNAQLRLPGGSDFRQDNPTDTITAVTVTNLNDSSVRIKVTGKAGLPTTEVIQSDQGLVLSVAALPDITIQPRPALETPAEPARQPNAPRPTEQESAPKPPAAETKSEETPKAEADNEPLELIVAAERPEVPPPGSTPVYTISVPEIRKQGANSAAEVLRGLPGFAVNDFGFGADIHTGTYYRGQSINQSVYLLDGRPVNSNVNTYHGGFDLNSIPTESIERVELSSGTSSTLYGSEAFGGVVNIVTKQGEEIPKLGGLTEFGSYGQSNYRGSYGGTFGPLKFNLSYEDFSADNDYPVPLGAANRDDQGRLFNGDTAVSNYVGSLSYELNDRNTLSLNAYKTSSRRGLLYFGFPLQRDRLDHDVLNMGLSSRTLLGKGEDSVLRTSLSYNQDYFNTYGPTQNVFYRTGTLNSRGLAGRVEHDWQVAHSNNLRWGLDLRNDFLTGEVLSNDPLRAALNETENRDRFYTALFALNTWKVSDQFQAELGLRQNFNSEFGNYLNPSVGLRWDPLRAVAVRGSWASVQRNPGLDQLYVYDSVHNWLPNAELSPEKGSSWTAGVDLNLAKNLTGQFTYFGSRLSDRLGIQAGRWANIGLVDTHGFEAALRWQIAPRWSTFLNYTYTDAKIKIGLEQGLQLALVPYSVGQFGIGYQSGGWQVNLFASYFSGARRAFFNGTNFTSGETTSNRDFSPSYLNLDLGVRIPLFSGLGLNVFVENLIGNSYEKVNRIYQPGRTVRIGISSDL